MNDDYKAVVDLIISLLDYWSGILNNIYIKKTLSFNTCFINFIYHVNCLLMRICFIKVAPVFLKALRKKGPQSKCSQTNGNMI